VLEAGKSSIRARLAGGACYGVIGLAVLVVPPFLSGFVQGVMVKIFVYAIFALSLNLLWGYTGLFSLGHAAYFGVGGYVVGILSAKLGIDNFWITALAGVGVATALAAILGVIALRVSGSYFLLVTLALGELIYSVAVKWRSLTGGSNGLAGISLPNLHLPLLGPSNMVFYYLVLVVLVVCALVSWTLVRSSFGYALQGIREDPVRMASLGYNVWLYRYLAFVIAGCLAGVAGVLFAHFSGIMAPTHVSIVTSTMGMLMVILGSCTTVFGPILGAAIVILLQQIASIYMPTRWPLILGGVFVLVVMFLPGGVGLYLARIWRRIAYGTTARR
jgi:branched-chain amino acid transport system permease protein